MCVRICGPQQYVGICLLLTGLGSHSSSSASLLVTGCSKTILFATQATHRQNAKRNVHHLITRCDGVQIVCPCVLASNAFGMRHLVAARSRRQASVFLVAYRYMTADTCAANDVHSIGLRVRLAGIVLDCFVLAHFGRSGRVGRSACGLNGTLNTYCVRGRETPKTRRLAGVRVFFTRCTVSTSCMRSPVPNRFRYVTKIRVYSNSYFSINCL